MHRMKFYNINDNKCNNCNSPETVEHYIMYCDKYEHERDILLTNILEHESNDFKNKEEIKIENILYPSIKYDKESFINDQQTFKEKNNQYRIDILNQLYHYVIKTKRFKYNKLHLQLFININNL